MKRVLACLVLAPVVQAQYVSDRCYRTVAIDPGSLVMRLSGQFPPGDEPPKEEHFLFSVSGRDIEHIIPREPGQPPLHTEYFHITPESVLKQGSDYQELFSGRFGAIVAHTEYFYPAAGYGPPAVDFDVHGDTLEQVREQPRIGGELPNSKARLDSITVARVFSSAGETVVAVGMYNPAGDLLCVHKDAFKSGKRVSLPAVLGVRTLDDQINDDKERFEFPIRLAVDEFRRTPATFYTRTDGETPLSIVSFHYDHNSAIEQYIFKDSVRDSRTFELRHLQFPVTENDRAMASIAEGLPLRTMDQRSAWRPK